MDWIKEVTDKNRVEIVKEMENDFYPQYTINDLSNSEKEILISQIKEDKL